MRSAGAVDAEEVVRATAATGDTDDRGETRAGEEKKKDELSEMKGRQ